MQLQALNELSIMGSSFYSHARYFCRAPCVSANLSYIEPTEILTFILSYSFPELDNWQISSIVSVSASAMVYISTQVHAL